MHAMILRRALTELWSGLCGAMKTEDEESAEKYRQSKEAVQRIFGVKLLEVGGRCYLHEQAYDECGEAEI